MTGRAGRLVPLLAALRAIALGWAGCAKLYRTEAKRAATTGPLLRVGVTSTYPPVIFRQEGQFAGIEADLAALLGTRLGRTVHFVEVPWTGQIDALLAGRTDIVMVGHVDHRRARAPRGLRAEPYLEGGPDGGGADGRTSARYPSREAVLADAWPRWG